MSERYSYRERMICSWGLLPAVLCATKAVDELSLSTGSKVVREDHCVMLILLQIPKLGSEGSGKREGGDAVLSVQKEWFS